MKLNHFQLLLLAQKGLSSEYVANKILKKIQIKNKHLKLYKTYEEAYRSVKLGINNILIVANAYENINNFYMDNSLQLLGTTIESTPEYGIAIRPNFDLNIEKNMKIVSHPAPVKRLQYYTNNEKCIFYKVKFKIIHANSTSSAAKLVLNKKYNLCLTNEQAVRKYNLKFVTKTTSIDMVWSIFGKFKELLYIQNI